MSNSRVIRFPSHAPRVAGRKSRRAAADSANRPSIQHILDQLPGIRERMADVIESLADGFSLYDPEDRLVLWNERYANIVSYARHLLAPGVSYDTLLRQCAHQHFLGQLVTEEERDAWIRQAHEYQRNQGTYERQTQDGRCYLVSRRRTQQNFIAVVWTEITDRKRAEEALKANEQLYRELFEGSVQGIVIQTRRKIVLANRAFARIFGLRSIHEIKSDKDLDGVVAPHERSRLRDLRRAHFANPGSYRDYEFQGLKRDGTIIWVQATAVPITWKGEPAVQTTYFDITERKIFQEELIAKKLETVGAMAHGIALEFHRVFSAIMDAVHLAKMEAYAAGMDAVSEHLSEAELQGANVTDLTQQLLFLYRGGIPVKERTTIAEILKDSLPFSGMGPNVVPLQRSNAKITISLARDLWPVYVDKSQLITVLRSLIGNGLQAMPSGGTLKLSAENFLIARKLKGLPLAPGRYLKVAIADRGPGVSAEFLDRIFDPYFAPVGRQGGLALASAYSIVKQHDGAITVSSRLGKGTRMTVYLPAARDESE